MKEVFWDKTIRDNSHYGMLNDKGNQHELFISAAEYVSELTDGLNVCFYPDEHSVPHIHFFSDDLTVDGALYLCKPAYYFHGSHISKLTKLQLIELTSKIKKKYLSIKSQWNLVNSDCLLLDDCCPDYSTLAEDI